MTASKSLVFQCDGVEVREQEYCIVREGEIFSVEPRAFQVLVYLLRNPRKLIKKEELLQAVWGDVAVTENSLARAILKLRQILEDDARSPRYIETVSRIGYRFIGSVAIQMDRASSKAEDHGLAVVEEGGNGTLGPSPEAAPTFGPADAPSLVSGTTYKDARVPFSSRTARRSALPIAASILILAGAVWYLRRPLPPPRITAYIQVTHDGRTKRVGGTDGSRLYFTQFSPSQIAQVGVNGGEIAPLPLGVPAVSVVLMDISPDGSKALVGTFEQNHGTPGQWVVPVLGGAAKRLEDGAGETFSPDGGSVVYSALNGDIFKVHIDGSDKRKLASVGTQAYGFRWSPDGKVIRFSIADEGLWETSQDGAGVHRQLPGWKEGIPCCGEWTRDGSFFLFLANDQIWALDERHSMLRQPPAGPIQLTNGPLHWSSLVPGKDGKTIFMDGATPRGELSRIDLKTGSFRPFLGGISAEFVSFSPDGNFVAYATFPEGILWRANRDGSDRMQLTQPPEHVVNPRWSPNSKEIVYITETPDGHDSIRRISALDGAPLWLLPEESAEMHDANWSPDGKKVLFARSPGHGFITGKRDMRIVDIETRQVSILPGSDELWSPRWSPDGRYITALRGVTADLSLFDYATRQWRTLPCGGDVEFPSFSRDSRFIYFLRVGRDQGVFRVPVHGGKVERVVDMTDWHLTGFTGSSMSLDPTDAPLLLRDTGTDDIYALTLEEK